MLILILVLVIDIDKLIIINYINYYIQVRSKFYPVDAIFGNESR